jgi:PAS domain S-box-containing protein
VEDINDGYFVIQDGRFVYFNQAFANLLEDKNEVILVREFLRLFSLKYPEGTSKENQDHGSQNEVEISGKDGEDLILEIRWSVIDYNRRSAFAGICKDITEKKKAEMALQEKVKELEKWYRLTVDRELKMTELKRRIRELKSRRKLVRKNQNI